MGEQKFINRIELIENPRKYIEDFANAGGIIRVFRTILDARMGSCPQHADRKINIVAIKDYAPYSSRTPEIEWQIPKPPSDMPVRTHLTIFPTPLVDVHYLHVFFNPFNAQGANPLKLDLFGFDFREEGSGSISLTNGCSYFFINDPNYSFSAVLDGRRVKIKGKEFNVSEFGWEY